VLELRRFQSHITNLLTCNNNHHTHNKSNKMCLPTILPSPECFAVVVKKTSSKRRLSFAPEISHVVGTVLPRREYTAAEIEQCWWSASDQKAFRANSKAVASSVRKGERSFVALLDDTYKVAHDLSHRLSDTAVNDLLNDPTTYALNLPLIGEERRGLEKGISRLHCFERKARAKTSRGTVLELAQLGASGDEISKIYAMHCRTSRIYARIMGSADRRV
jgi:hypothetical protein